MKKFPTSKKLWIPVLVVVLVVHSFLLLMGVLVFYADRQVSQFGAEQEFKTFLGQITKGMFVTGVIDVPENKVYMPELNISVPLNETSRNLLYSYNESFDDTPESAIVSLRHVVNRQLDKIGQNSCTQTTYIEATDAPRDQEGKKHAGSVALQDGRTLQVYVNTQDICKAVWAVDANPDLLAEVLLKARSY
jgi:hypothetical protein